MIPSNTTDQSYCISGTFRATKLQQTSADLSGKGRQTGIEQNGGLIVTGIGDIPKQIALLESYSQY
jgi:hypothetical protein